MGDLANVVSFSLYGKELDRTTIHKLKVLKDRIDRQRIYSMHAEQEKKAATVRKVAARARGKAQSAAVSPPKQGNSTFKSIERHQSPGFYRRSSRASRRSSTRSA